MRDRTAASKPLVFPLRRAEPHHQARHSSEDARVRHPFGLVPLKEARLARKVTLAFGFMSFIPLLLIVLAFVAFVFPAVQGSAQESLGLLIFGIIGSIFVGYYVLKRTIGAVMEVVNQARAVTQKQIGEPIASADGDEIGELARTFNRITKALEQKVEELESSRALIKRLLSRIGSAIVSYEGIDSLLELIVENASAALVAQKGCLLLIDGEKQELEVKTAWPPNERHGLALVRMKLGEGIAGWVAKSGSPMRGTGAPDAIGLSNGQAREGAQMCVPLAIREKTMGVVAVFREDITRPFTEDDEVLLTTIGSQIAVAIENYRLNLDIERTYLETIRALALAVEAKDPYSAGHSKRVGFYALKIAQAMGSDEEIKKILKDAGLLHDVGKIGIKDEILQKAGALTPEEQRIMQQHPLIGEAILKPLRSLDKVAQLVRCHHEHYDGSGYPNGLAGEAIPLAARILDVVDTYDAMITDRPYRKRMTPEEAEDELKRKAGKQFDPRVVEAFLNVLAEKEQHAAYPQA